MKAILETPVLFIVFNRPDLSQKVFSEIRRARPARLYISADGPREHVLSDIKNCLETREIINQIDWECVVHTRFNETNLGCRLALSSAIDWFFYHEEEGIILEDDCLPTTSFFSFCRDLLSYYRDDSRVMHISGTNLLGETTTADGSYFFSRRPVIWGWATWRRAWRFYDVKVKSLPDFIAQEKIKTIYDQPYLQKAYLNAFKIMFNGKGDTWDWQWYYTVMSQNGLAIIPNKNLISNIGFREDATHTNMVNNQFSNIRRYDDLEIRHPKFILPDYPTEIALNSEFAKKTVFEKITNRVKKYLR